MSEGDEDPTRSAGVLAADDLFDRQRGLRLYGPFPATARGVDARGGVFRAEAEVEVISAREVLLRLGPAPEPGSTLLVVMRFSRDWSDGILAPTVALRGPVLRVESGPRGGDAVAVAISRCRFL